MTTESQSITEACRAARDAFHFLSSLDTEVKDACLEDLAGRLEAATDQILAANTDDLEAGREEGLSDALLDRLELTDERIAGMADGVREVKALPDPVGEVVESWEIPNGLQIEKRRVPIGVVAVIYEARPNVTIDAAVLCLKSGNAAVLRGSSSARASNLALGEVLNESLKASGIPTAAVTLVTGGGREELAEIATQEGVVDLVIPRGGEGLKAALKEVATVPVMYAAAGNCHVYVHSDADLEMASRIAFNSKVQRPGVCNAAETLLVDSAVANDFLPIALPELAAAGVELVGDEKVVALAPDGVEVGLADDADWDTEYHALKMAVGVVDSLDQAIEHINSHGTNHSEAIVTSSDDAAREFTDRVDSAAVYVNASTRFTDGYEFGFGSEIGISTQKLHARGPIGLRELTSQRYVVRGTGQVRE